MRFKEESSTRKALLGSIPFIDIFMCSRVSIVALEIMHNAYYYGKKGIWGNKESCKGYVSMAELGIGNSSV